MSQRPVGKHIPSPLTRRRFVATIRKILPCFWVVLFVVVPCLASFSGTVRAGDRIEAAGTALEYALPATAIGLTLAHRDKQGAWQFGESAALTAGATIGLKYAINEQRPNGGDYSFPSGHTSISFASAEFMRRRYGWKYGLPAYSAAVFVAYSRVEANQHYTHDVVAGAAIGFLSSYLLTRPYKGWHIRAEADRKYFGMWLSRIW
jgi:membrane-associated phospholipid phosphatase